MDIKQFEQRKKDHIQYSLDSKNQSDIKSDFDLIEIPHEALPDFDFKDVKINSKILNKERSTPFYINSMTAGHKEAYKLNETMAQVAQSRGWMMAVGSQRRQLHEESAVQEWVKLRKSVPNVSLIANIGMAQLITSSTKQIQKLIDTVQAEALFVHLNVLQECLQPEGTPHYKGSLKALKKIIKELEVPVLLKETGCGVSRSTFQKVNKMGLYAFDVSGLGGTHWGRIEGDRSEVGSLTQIASQTFKNWGVSTVRSLLQAQQLKLDYDVWASGGVRSGLDAAKLIALGANAVGFAQPVLVNALKGEKELDNWMNQIEFEFKIAMFCSGSENIKSLKKCL